MGQNLCASRIIAAIALRLSALPNGRLMEDPSLHLAASVFRTQTWLYWLMISATIPGMHPLLEDRADRNHNFRGQHGQSTNHSNQI